MDEFLGHITRVSLDESVEPVVAGTSVFVGTVVSMIQSQQFGRSIAHVDASQLETCVFHVLKIRVHALMLS